MVYYPAGRVSGLCMAIFVRRSSPVLNSEDMSDAVIPDVPPNLVEIM